MKSWKGLISMATPIYQENREVVAALNMAAHKFIVSIEDMVDRLAPHLVSAADQISARLGYPRDDEARPR
jgi:DNA-binding IclR family transcriptional regulator